MRAVGTALIDDPARPPHLTDSEREHGRVAVDGLKQVGRHADVAPDEGDAKVAVTVHDLGRGTAEHDRKKLAVAKLSLDQRRKARDMIVVAAQLGLKHAAQLHYTQHTPERWDGINQDRHAATGDFPRSADCSGFYTWCAWNGLFVLFKQPDVVNGGGWRWGNTWSMLQHGRRVFHVADVIRGDAVLYGAPSHTAVVVGWDRDEEDGKRKPFVISNGSEAGPFYRPFNYRDDVHSVRRFVLSA